MLLKEKSTLTYDVECTASSVWFKLFKDHYSLHDVKVSSESVIADVKVATEVLEPLDKQIID